MNTTSETTANISLEQMLRALDEAREYRADLDEHEWCSISVRAIYIARTGSPVRHVHLSDFAVCILETIDQLVEDGELPEELTSSLEWAELLIDIAGLEPGDETREAKRARDCLAQARSAIAWMAVEYPNANFDTAYAAIKAARDEAAYDLGTASDLMLQALSEAVFSVSLKARRHETAIWRSLDLIGLIRRGLKLSRKPAGGTAPRRG